MKPPKELKLKDGRKPQDLKNSEVLDVLFNHADRDHQDYNPGGETLQAAVSTARKFSDERKAQENAKREKGKEANKKRAAEFKKQVAAFIDSEPGLMGTKYAEKLSGWIKGDTDLIRLAAEDGRSWQSLDLKYTRKNESGDPYEYGGVLKIVREILKARRKSATDKA